MNCEDLSQLKNKISEYIISQDYLRPEIKISLQDLKSGTLDFEVTLVNISDIILVNSDLSNNLIEEYSRKILSAKPTKVKYTFRYLALMSKIPGYTVEQELRRSTQTTKLYLVITLSRIKGIINASVDNYNIFALGKIDQVIGAQVFSPFGKNDLFSIQGGTTNHPDRFYTFMTGYSRPINSYGSFINLIGSRTISNASLHNSVPTKSGVDILMSSNIGHHLYLDSKNDLIGAINYSIMESKVYEVDTNNVAIPSLYTQYYSVGAGLQYLFKDSFNGDNVIGVAYNRGIGGKYNDYTGNNSPINLEYDLSGLNVSRNQPLFSDFSLFSAATASKVTKYAPGAVGLALGGRGYGRGYSAGTLIGNNLLAASFELRYNKAIKDSEAINNINLYMFYDIGYIGPKDSDSTPNVCNLSSVGPGLRMNLLYDIQLSSEVAFPIRKNYIMGDLVYKAIPKATFFIGKTFKY
jgi:hemolysin activation/secretion protein